MPAGAVFCGSCGALARMPAAAVLDAVEVPASPVPAGPLAEGDHPELEDLDDADVVLAGAEVPLPDDAHHAGRRGRTAVAAVVLGSALVAASILPGGQPTEQLIGRLDVASGASSTAPPANDLRLAWVEDSRASVYGGGQPYGGIGAVADGRAVVHGQVVDLETGATIGLAQGGVTGESRHAARDVATIVGDELIVIDVLTGVVVSRARLAATGDDAVPAGTAIARRDGVSVFSATSVDLTGLSGEESRYVRVDDEGTVLGVLEGIPADQWSDTKRSSPYIAMFQYGAHMGAEGLGPLEAASVVEIATGRTVLRRPVDLSASGPVALPQGAALSVASDWFGNPSVMSVWEDVALFAQPLDEAATFGAVGTWRVEVYSLPDGMRRAAVTLSSSDRPTLTGVASDGTTLVAVREGTLIAVHGIAPSREPRVVRSVVVDSQMIGQQSGSSLADQAVGLDGDVLVVAEATDRGTIAAYALDGDQLWHVAAPSVRNLDVGGGLAVWTSDDDPRARVLRVVDGSQVATVVATGTYAEVSPVASTADVVGIAGEWGRFSGGAQLSSVEWRRLRDGKIRTTQQALGRWLTAPAGGPSPSEVASPLAEPRPALTDNDLAAATLAGWIVDAGGERTPVIVRSRVPSVLERLRPDLTWEVIETPTAASRPSDAPEGYGFVATAFGERLVTYTESFDVIGDAFIQGPTPDETVVVKSLLPYLATDGVLLGIRFDDTYGRVDVMGADPATGDTIWTRPSNFRGSLPAVGGGIIAQVDGPLVRAIDVLDGTDRWTFPSDVNLTGLVVITTDHAIVTGLFGEVIALDIETGVEQWRTSLGGVPTGGMTAAGDHVLLGTGAGDVVHLDGRGRLVQRLRAAGLPILSIAVIDEMVVVTTSQSVIGLRQDGRGVSRRDEVDVP